MKLLLRLRMTLYVGITMATCICIRWLISWYKTAKRRKRGNGYTNGMFAHNFKLLKSFHILMHFALFLQARDWYKGDIQRARRFDVEKSTFDFSSFFDVQYKNVEKLQCNFNVFWTLKRTSKCRWNTVVDISTFFRVEKTFKNVRILRLLFFNAFRHRSKFVEIWS